MQYKEIAENIIVIEGYAILEALSIFDPKLRKEMSVKKALAAFNLLHSTDPRNYPSVYEGDDPSIGAAIKSQHVYRPNLKDLYHDAIVRPLVNTELYRVYNNALQQTNQVKEKVEIMKRFERSARKLIEYSKPWEDLKKTAEENKDKKADEILKEWREKQNT